MQSLSHHSAGLRLAAVGAVAGLTVTMAPGVPAQAAPEPTQRRTVVVELAVAGAPAQTVATQQGVWPATLVEAHGARPDSNDLLVVKRSGKKVKGEKRRLRAGDKVALVDVRRKTRSKKVRVKPRTVTTGTTKLKPGQRKVVAKGRPAVHKVRVRRTLHNDKVVDRTVVSRKVVRKAKARRVLVGRKASSVPGTDGLNWAALARCESGGNPRAVNPSGYYGLYQFNVGTWRSVGGSGMPHQASPAEQTHRAKLLYKSRGAQPWPHCGRYL